MQRRLFGTSGIRGLINTKITPEFSAELGLTAAAFFGQGSTIIVARDHRPHAQVVEMSLISGLLAGGVNVLEAGITPTPAVLWAVKELDVDGAIVCTGSHTPSEIVGILFFKKDTSELDRAEEAIFEDILFQNKYKRVPWNEVGTFDYISIEDVYIDAVLNNANTNHIEDRTVVVDPGNGASSGLLKTILEMAGAEVIAINDLPDPRFPRRDPFPRPQNLQRLGKLVRGINADLGVASDGDGDRAIFAADDGNVYWGDISSALFAIDAIKYRNIKRIVVTINTSSVVELVSRQLGGAVHYCDVGPPAIASKMKETGAGLGLEESGKYIWSNAIYYGDAALATLRMLEFLEHEGLAFSNLVKQLPRRHLAKIALDCPDEIKGQVTERILQHIEHSPPASIKNTIKIYTGVKIFFEDDSWLLFRPSGTEAKYRIHAESDSEDKALRLLEYGKNIVEEIIHSLIR